MEQPTITNLLTNNAKSAATYYNYQEKQLAITKNAMTNMYKICPHN